MTIRKMHTLTNIAQLRQLLFALKISYIKIKDLNRKRSYGLNRYVVQPLL